MNVLGWFIAVCGLVGIVFGIRMMLKQKKLGTVPFRKPSEIANSGAQAGDAKGMVSTEGSVDLGPQPLIAPMSGQPCIAYEIKVERKWEKHVATQNGSQKKTGSDVLFSESKGGVFGITDGAGTVQVDASGGIDADMDKGHQSSMKVGAIIPGTLQFGQLQMNTPAILSTDSRTVEFVGTERIVKPSPSLFALGQLVAGPAGTTLATPKGIGTGKLILSAKGREALAGTTKRNMILGYAIGGVAFVGGTVLGITGPKAQSTSCPSTIAETQTACDARVTSKSGTDHTWTVSTGGTYEISVTEPKVKLPLDSVVTVYAANGDVVAEHDEGAAGDGEKLTHTFTPGKYRINVKDRTGMTLSGGLSYKLAIGKAEASTAPAEIGNGAVEPSDTMDSKPSAAAKPSDTPAARLAPKPGSAPQKR
jgi:hypothetical protein